MRGVVGAGILAAGWGAGYLSSDIENKLAQRNVANLSQAIADCDSEVLRIQADFNAARDALWAAGGGAR